MFFKRGVRYVPLLLFKSIFSVFYLLQYKSKKYFSVLSNSFMFILLLLLLYLQLDAGELFSPVSYYQKEWLVPAYAAYQKKRNEEYEQAWANVSNQSACMELKRLFEEKNKEAHNQQLIIDVYLLELPKCLQEKDLEKQLSQDQLNAMLKGYSPSADSVRLKLLFFDIRTKLQSVCPHMVFDQTYAETFEHPFMAIKTFCFELLCINSFIIQQHNKNRKTEYADEFHFNLFCHALTAANDVATSMAFLTRIQPLINQKLLDYKLDSQKRTVYSKFYKTIQKYQQSYGHVNQGGSETLTNSQIAKLLESSKSIFPKLPITQGLDTVLKKYEFRLTADYCLFDFACQLFSILDKPYQDSKVQFRYDVYHHNFSRFFELYAFKPLVDKLENRQYIDNFKQVFYKNMFLLLYDPLLVSNKKKISDRDDYIYDGQKQLYQKEINQRDSKFIWIKEDLERLKTINTHYLNADHFLWWLFFIEHVFVAGQQDAKRVNSDEVDELKNLFENFCKNQTDKIFDTSAYAVPYDYLNAAVDFIKLNHESRKVYQQKVNENIKRLLSMYNEDSKKIGYKVLKAKGQCNINCAFKDFGSYDCLCEHKCMSVNQFAYNERKRYLAHKAFLEQMKAFVKARNFLNGFYNGLSHENIHLYSDKFEVNRADILQLIGKTFWGNASIESYRKQLYHAARFELLWQKETVHNNLNVEEVWKMFRKELQGMIDKKQSKAFQVFLHCFDSAMRDLPYPLLCPSDRLIMLTNVLIDFVVNPLFYAHAFNFNMVDQVLRLETEEKQKTFFENEAALITKINEQNISEIIDSFPAGLQPSKIKDMFQSQLNKEQVNVSVEQAIEFSYLLKQLVLTIAQNFVALKHEAGGCLVALAKQYDLELEIVHSFILHSFILESLRIAFVSNSETVHFENKFNTTSLFSEFLWLMLSKKKHVFEEALAVEQNISTNESGNDISFTSDSDEIFLDERPILIQYFKNKSNQKNITEQHNGQAQLTEESKPSGQPIKGENSVLKLFWKIYELCMQIKAYLFSLTSHIWASA